MALGAHDEKATGLDDLLAVGGYLLLLLGKDRLVLLLEGRVVGADPAGGDLLPGKVLGAAAELDVDAAPGHVGGDRHRTGPAGLGDRLALALGELGLGVEDGVADAALAYALIAGPDPLDPNSLHQPAPTLAGWNKTGIDGLRIGVFWPWFRHASAEVVSACEALLAKFTSLGAQVIDVVIPDLEAGRVAHVITIASEMAQAMNQYHRQHHRQHGLDVRTNLTLARAFTALDYVQAQRVRTRLMANFQHVFESVDVIVTPATGIAAPPIPASALPDGDSDLTTLAEIMRFVTPANLTGLPAISFPAGYSPAGLPVGMQAIGRAWDEVTLLRLALAAEGLVERKAPQVYFKTL